jgi:hypothetical protein
MRIETTDTSIKLVERRESDGYWVVRWDFKPKLDSEGNETGVYWYEEEAYNWIPTIEYIQRTIVEWLNKQTDGVIQHGFVWNGINVLLTDENKFNYKAITDEAARRETARAIWDKENPELAGKDVVISMGVDENGNEVKIATPTGRPKSLLPVTLKLGESNLPENFHTFATLTELQEFFAAGVDHLIGAYGSGWTKVATFDWNPYIKALEEL